MPDKIKYLQTPTLPKTPVGDGSEDAVKTLVDGYGQGGGGSGGVEITEQEYAEILTAIRNKPTPRDGFDYRLKTDLTWEEYVLPPVEEDDADATAEDLYEALAELGVISREDI